MSRSRAPEKLEGIEEVQGRLTLWRQGRRAGQPMPEELWTAAADLAARHSVFAVSRSLGLEFNKLKAYFERRHPQLVKAGQKHPAKRRETAPVAAAAGGFMEVDASELFGKTAGPTEAVVELFASDGARMRISLRSPTTVDLAGMVTAFARRGERCCR